MISDSDFIETHIIKLRSYSYACIGKHFNVEAKATYINFNWHCDILITENVSEYDGIIWEYSTITRLNNGFVLKEEVGIGRVKETMKQHIKTFFDKVIDFL